MKQSRHIRHYRTHIRLVNPNVNKRFITSSARTSFSEELLHQINNLSESDMPAIYVFIDDLFPRHLKYAETLDFEDLKTFVKHLIIQKKKW